MKSTLHFVTSRGNFYAIPQRDRYKVTFVVAQIKGFFWPEIVYKKMSSLWFKMDVISSQL